MSRRRYLEEGVGRTALELHRETGISISTIINEAAYRMRQTQVSGAQVLADMRKEYTEGRADEWSKVHDPRGE